MLTVIGLWKINFVQYYSCLLLKSASFSLKSAIQNVYRFGQYLKNVTPIHVPYMSFSLQSVVFWWVAMERLQFLSLNSLILKFALKYNFFNWHIQYCWPAYLGSVSHLQKYINSSCVLASMSSGILKIQICSLNKKISSGIHPLMYCAAYKLKIGWQIVLFWEKKKKSLVYFKFPNISVHLALGFNTFA